MATRITIENLQRAVEALNRLTGNPVDAWKKDNGKHIAQIGNFHLDRAYGGVAVVQHTSEGGGTRTIIERGTAREVYEKVHAYRNGYSAAIGIVTKRFNIDA